MLVNACVYMGSFLTARCADQGLSHMLGVTTMRHGTNPLSWLSIHLVGFQPIMGDSCIGGDKGVASEGKNNNRVYLACDSDDYLSHSFNVKIMSNFLMRLIPRLYAILSTTNLCTALISLPTLGECLVEDQNYTAVQKITTLSIGILTLPISLLIPTIKVRIDPESINEFDLNEVGVSLDCSTDKPIYPHRIGILGTLWNGLTYKVVTRTLHNPQRCITGIAMLSLSSIAAYWVHTKIPHVLTTHKTAVIIGTILAIV